MLTSLKATEKPEHLNPDPVATRCGHIFHKGCIKKMISEQASSRIACPACSRPVVLAQLRLVKFFYPPKIESLSRKIDKLNLENDVLAQQLDEVRKLRQRRKYEQDVVSGKIDEMKNKVKLKEEKCAEKREQLKAIRFNGQSIPEMEESALDLKDRIFNMSRSNAVLLKQLEYVMQNVNNASKLQENKEILRSLKKYFSGNISTESWKINDCAAGKHLVSTDNNQNITGPEDDPLSSMMTQLVGNRQKISSAIEVVDDMYSSMQKQNREHYCQLEYSHQQSSPHHAEHPKNPNPLLFSNMAGDDGQPGCIVINDLNNNLTHKNAAQFLRLDPALLRQNLQVTKNGDFINCSWRRRHVDQADADRHQNIHVSIAKATPKTGFSLNNTESNVSFGKVVMLPPVEAPSQTFPSGMAEFVLDITREKHRKTEKRHRKSKVKLGKSIKKSFKHSKTFSSSSLDFRH